MTDSAAPAASAAGGAGRGCPVKHEGSPSGGGGGYWSSLFGDGGSAGAGLRGSDSASLATPPSGNASIASTTSKDGGEGGCPVKHDATGTGSNIAGSFPFAGAAEVAASTATTPASLEEASRHPQSPRPDQTVPLSTVRTVSTIPRGETPTPEATVPAGSPGGSGEGQKAKGCAPSHQPADSRKWVYPSDQQFYNAMRRKGWEVPDESTVPWIVQIHNAVNERGWAEVRRWESSLHGCDDPKLVRFLGRPTDTSPRAWFNTNVLMYRPPFDRHDWYVDRGDGSAPRRYVIDFYDGNDGSGGGDETQAADSSSASATPPPRPPAMYLDVRPALDDTDAFGDRAKMFVRDAFPGLFAAFGTSGDNPGGTTSDASSTNASVSGVPKRSGATEN